MAPLQLYLYVDGKTVEVSGAISGIFFFCGGVFPGLRLTCARENLLLHLLQQIALPFHFAAFDLEQDERAKSPFTISRPIVVTACIFGKAFLHVCRLVGAAMCPACLCGSHDRWP